MADFDYELDPIGNRIGLTETLALPVLIEEVTAFLEANGQLVLEAESATKTDGTTHRPIPSEAVTTRHFGVPSGYV